MNGNVGNMATSRCPSSYISRLPPELLGEVFSHLSTPPPSSKALRLNPSESILIKDSSSRDDDIAQGEISTTLKTVSLVSRHLRANVLPLLFRHVVWRVDVAEIRETWASTRRDPQATFPVLRFLQGHGLGWRVESLTMIVTDEGDSIKVSIPRYATMTRGQIQAHNWVWGEVLDVVDLERLTIFASPVVLGAMVALARYSRIYLAHAYRFGMRWHILSLETTRKLSERRTGAESAELGADTVGMAPQTSTADEKSSSPASAESSASMPNIMDDEPASMEDVNTPAPLLTIRPWTSLLLNEGSFLPFYSQVNQDHDFDACPPSILPALLLNRYPRLHIPFSTPDPNDPSLDEPTSPLFPPGVTRSTYVAEFPLATHFQHIVSNLPSITHLHLQLVPGGLDSKLKSPGCSPDIDDGEARALYKSSYEMHWAMRHGWEEQDECYKMIWATRLGAGVKRSDNWWRLTELESADEVNDFTWWALLHKLFHGTASDWEEERDGVLARKVLVGSRAKMSSAAPDVETDSTADQGPWLKSGRCKLTRLAFRGIASLPVPVSPLSPQFSPNSPMGNALYYPDSPYPWESESMTPMDYPSSP